MSEFDNVLVVEGPDKKTALHMIDLLVKAIDDGTVVVTEVDMADGIGHTANEIGNTSAINHSYTGLKVMKIFYRGV